MRYLPSRWLTLFVLYAALPTYAQESPQNAGEGEVTDVVVIASATSNVSLGALNQVRQVVATNVQNQADHHGRSVRIEEDPDISARANDCMDDPCFTAIGRDSQAAFLFLINLEFHGTQHNGTILLVDIKNGETIGSASAILPAEPSRFAPALSNPISPLISALTSILPTTGTLDITIEQDGVTLFLNEEEVGISPTPPLEDISPGLHTIRLTKDGFVDHETQVMVDAGETTPVRLSMTPIPPAEPVEEKSPIWKKWWFWTAVGAVVVGTGLGVGLGVGLSEEETTSKQQWGVPFPDYEAR